MEINLGKLEGMLEGLQAELNQLNKRLYGNGQPGIVDRVSKTESNINNLKDSIDKLADTIQANQEGAMCNIEEIKEIIAEQKKVNELSTNELKLLIQKQETIVSEQAESQKVQTKAIMDLTSLMNTHIQDKGVHSLKGLFLNREGILYILLTFLVLHTLFPEVTLEQVKLFFLKLIGL